MKSRFTLSYSPKELATTTKALEMAKLADVDITIVHTIVNQLMYDEIFSDILLYYRIVAVADSYTLEAIDQLLVSCTLTSAISESVDMRSWAKHYRQNANGMLMIMQLATSIAHEKFKQQSTSLEFAHADESQIISVAQFPMKLAKLIKTRKNFWAQRYSVQAKVQVQKQKEGYEVSYLYQLPPLAIRSIIIPQLKCKVMAIVTFEISEEGEVTTVLKSL